MLAKSRVRSRAAPAPSAASRAAERVRVTPAAMPSSLAQAVKQVQVSAASLSTFLAKSQVPAAMKDNQFQNVRRSLPKATCSFFAPSNIRQFSKHHRKDLNRVLRRLLATDAKPPTEGTPAPDQSSAPPPPFNPFEAPSQDPNAATPGKAPEGNLDPGKQMQFQKVGWLRTFVQLLMALLAALCLFELYCIIFGSDDWASYLSFLPILNWYPYSQLGEISPFWIAAPLILGMLRRGAYKSLMMTQNTSFLVLVNALGFAALGAVSYRFYRLAEHFDVSPGWATVAAVPLSPLILAAMICNHETYRKITPQQPKRTSEERLNLWQFLSNAGERAIRDVEAESGFQSWIVPVYAAAYIYMRPYMPGWKTYIQRAEDAQRLAQAALPAGQTLTAIIPLLATPTPKPQPVQTTPPQSS